MPVNQVSYQPVAGQLMAAYRPVVLRVKATATGGSVLPPFVTCDIYIENIYFKSIIRTAADETGVDYALFSFDISRDVQEYLQPDYAPLSNTQILAAPHMSANIFCRFRSSDVNAEGFTVDEGVRPVQATKTTPAVAGDGLQSTTFYVINAALQHEDNQNLALHLATYKTGTWANSAFPLSHRLKPIFCPDDSDHFPIISTLEDCTPVDLVLHYKLKGQPNFSTASATPAATCEAVDFTTDIDGNQVTVNILLGAVPAGAQYFVRYKKQSSDVWIDAGTYSVLNPVFFVVGDDIAGVYDIEVINYCSACDNSEPTAGTFTLSGEVITLAWRGIDPFCVQQVLEQDIYIVLELRNNTSTESFFPNEDTPLSKLDQSKYDVYAKFYSDPTHLTPLSVTATGMKIYVKKHDANHLETGSNHYDRVEESFIIYTVNPAGVEVLLGNVVSFQTSTSYSPYPTISSTQTDTNTYTPFPTHKLIGGNNGTKGYANLQQYNTVTNTPTGTTKANVDSDPDYIAPVTDGATCPAGPETLRVVYGSAIEVAKVEIKYAPIPTYVYGDAVTDTTAGGYVYVYAIPKNVNVNLSIKAKTLDPGNTTGVLKVLINYVDGGGVAQAVTYNITNNVETAIPATLQNITVINISNF